MKHYFLKFGENREFGVTKEEFVAAERQAGFQPKGATGDEPCTAGFTGGTHVSGSIRELPQHPVPTIIEVPGIPANSNPFHYDEYHMGTDLVRGWMVMHPGFDRKENPQPLNYIILVNQRTGQRFKVDLKDYPMREDANETGL